MAAEINIMVVGKQAGCPGRRIHHCQGAGRCGLCVFADQDYDPGCAAATTFPDTRQRRRSGCHLGKRWISCWPWIERVSTASERAFR